jgi:hypothetical protein
MSTGTSVSTRKPYSLASATLPEDPQLIAELPEANANPSGRSPYSQQLDSSIRDLTRKLLACPQDAQVRRELNNALYEARHNINAVVSMDALIAADRILRGTKPTRGAGIPTGKFEFERYLGVPDRFRQVKVGTSDGEPVIQTQGGTYRIPDSVNANNDEELRSWVRGAFDSKSISNLYPLKVLTPKQAGSTTTRQTNPRAQDTNGTQANKKPSQNSPAEIKFLLKLVDTNTSRITSAEKEWADISKTKTLLNGLGDLVFGDGFGVYDKTRTKIDAIYQQAIRGESSLAEATRRINAEMTAFDKAHSKQVADFGGRASTGAAALAGVQTAAHLTVNGAVKQKFGPIGGFVAELGQRTLEDSVTGLLNGNLSQAFDPNRMGQNVRDALGNSLFLYGVTKFTPLAAVALTPLVTQAPRQVVPIASGLGFVAGDVMRSPVDLFVTALGQAAEQSQVRDEITRLQNTFPAQKNEYLSEVRAQWEEGRSPWIEKQVRQQAVAFENSKQNALKKARTQLDAQLNTALADVRKKVQTLPADTREQALAQATTKLKQERDSRYAAYSKQLEAQRPTRESLLKQANEAYSNAMQADVKQRSDQAQVEHKKTIDTLQARLTDLKAQAPGELGRQLEKTVESLPGSFVAGAALGPLPGSVTKLPGNNTFSVNPTLLARESAVSAALGVGSAGLDDLLNGQGLDPQKLIDVGVANAIPLPSMPGNGPKVSTSAQKPPESTQPEGSETKFRRFNSPPHNKSETTTAVGNDTGARPPKRNLSNVIRPANTRDIKSQRNYPAIVNSASPGDVPPTTGGLRIANGLALLQEHGVDMLSTLPRSAQDIASVLMDVTFKPIDKKDVWAAIESLGMTEEVKASMQAQLAKAPQQNANPRPSDASPQAQRHTPAQPVAPSVPLPDPLRLPPSELPKGIDAVIRNPDGSWRAHVETVDGGQVGALVEHRPNGKHYVRIGSALPDAASLGSPMEFITDKNLYIGIDRKMRIYTRAFDPTVEVTIPQEKTFSNSILSTVSKPFENIAIKIRQSGHDFRIGVQAEAGLSVPGPDNVLEAVGIQNLGATNILGQLFNKMMDVEWLRFGKVGSGSLVIGLDSFSAHSWTRFLGIGGRPAEFLTQGPQVGRFSGFIPLTNATGLQFKASTLSKEVKKAFVGEKSPFVFEPEGTVEAKHDTFKIPGKLRLNVVPVTQTPAGKDVFGVPIRPNAQYHVLQEALTIDKAMKEHYLKFPLVFYGERREETSGKFTFPKGAVLPDEFVKMFDRYLGEPVAIVNVPVRHADIHNASTIALPKSSSNASRYINADNLANPFRQGPNGEAPRIKYDPATLTVDFISKSAIRLSSVPGKEFYNKMGKLSQDISNLDVMVYESKFGKMVTPAKATELFPQSIPGVSDLFKVLQPYGGFDKVRYKANLFGVNFWFAKFSIPVYFVRDALEINPRIQSAKTSSILFNADGSLASTKAGAVDLRGVTSSIAVPEWLPHLFSREINTLPGGAHESIVNFLNKRKETATAHQLAAIEIFEKSTLQTGFRDLQPLSTEGRDRLLGLLRELSTPTAK